MDLPSGRCLVDEITAGSKPDVFQLPNAGAWHARAAWKLNTPDSDSPAQPEGSALIRLWPNTTT